VCLAEERDVVSKEKLMQTVWTDTFVTDDVLTRSISELRKIFADNPKKPHYIQTIPKGGYRLMLPVGEVRSPRPLEQKLPSKHESEATVTKRTLMALLSALLLTLLLTAYIVSRHSASAPERKRQVLAVLPFQNLSDDPQQE